MKKASVLLLMACLAFAGAVGAQQAIYPIYELATSDLPDLYDQSLQDWEDVLPGTSLTQDDFAPLAVNDGAGINTADLAYRVFMAWNSADQRIYFAIERVDDVYVNTYEGGNPANMWMDDGAEFMLDGDHSGGDYNGFSPDVYGEEQAKLLVGYQAQQYTMCPESPDGQILGNNTSASSWVCTLPWAEGSGYAYGQNPTTSIIETAFTAWDELNWNGPEVSKRSALYGNKVIGFQVSIMDWDYTTEDKRMTYHAFHTLSGLANTWRMADNFVGGQLVPCTGGDCGTTASAVSAESWGRVKASLR